MFITRKQSFITRKQCLLRVNNHLSREKDNISAEYFIVFIPIINFLRLENIK